jgi:glycine cleavage system H lipoate-binding protein
MREPSHNIANDAPVKCVWMLAGVVDYKLCDRDYDCDRCPFDQAFRDDAHAARSAQRQPMQNGLPAINDVEGYEVAPMLFYHPAHVWARIEDKGSVRIGLDDFGQKLAGRIYSVDLPEKGSRVESGHSCWRINHHAGETALASPVAGTIQFTNANISQHPSLINSDPYGDGWAVVVEPTRLGDCLKQLYYGRKVELWYQCDIGRLYQAMSDLLLKSIPSVGATMQDGGSRVGDFKSLLTADQMRRLIDSFLSAAVSGVTRETVQGR